MAIGEMVAAAALDLVGSPFRMHGRDAATGLDCVGLAVVALARAGRPAPVPDDYRLRGGLLECFDLWAADCGLAVAPPDGRHAAGDILLCEPGHRHFHVMVDAGAVLVHAHIGLRCVTAWPKPCPWPVRRRWRSTERI